jgi:peptidoglycan hydrolase-like protein with peptidoglycan-binding domain
MLHTSKVIAGKTITGKLIVGLTALSLTLGAALPAQALGRNERNVLKGIAAALIVGAIIHETQKPRRAKPAPKPAPQPVYRKVPTYTQPTYQPPVYEEPRQYRPKATAQPQVKTGRIIGKTSAYGSGINDTTAAQVFGTYSQYQRVTIQRKLASFGYYSGTLDGAFGPRTHQAVYEFARTAGKQDALSTSSGAYRIYDALLG